MKQLITTLTLSLLAPTVHAMDSDNFGNEPLPHLSLKIGTFYNNASKKLVICNNSEHGSCRAVQVDKKLKMPLNWSGFPVPLDELTTPHEVREWKNSIDRLSTTESFTPRSNKQFHVQHSHINNIILRCAFGYARVRDRKTGSLYLSIYACLSALRRKKHRFGCPPQKRHRHKIAIPPAATQADIELSFELGEESGGLQSTIVFTDAEDVRSTHKHVTPLLKKFFTDVNCDQEDASSNDSSRESESQAGSEEMKS